MSNPLVPLWLSSPVIKSWREPQVTIACLTSLVQALGAGRPLAATFMCEDEPAASKRLASLGPMARALHDPKDGKTSPQPWISTVLRAAPDLRAILADDAIWTDEFALYAADEPLSEKAPDFRTALTNASSHVDWAVSQEVGVSQWELLYGPGFRPDQIRKVVAGVFSAHGVEVQFHSDEDLLRTR